METLVSSFSTFSLPLCSITTRETGWAVPGKQHLEADNWPLSVTALITVELRCLKTQRGREERRNQDGWNGEETERGENKGRGRGEEEDGWRVDVRRSGKVRHKEERLSFYPLSYSQHVSIWLYLKSTFFKFSVLLCLFSYHLHLFPSLSPVRPLLSPLHSLHCQLYTLSEQLKPIDSAC